MCVSSTVILWLDSSGGAAQKDPDVASLPWSYPTDLLSLETQGEPEAANKVGGEREARGQQPGTEIWRQALGFGQARAKSGEALGWQCTEIGSGEGENAAGHRRR